jgi:phosphoserine phosphatase
MTQPPLCVDLDGTLIALDTLAECLRILIREKPWWSPLLPLYLLQGRAVFKDCLAQLVKFEPEQLPYRRQVLEFLREEQARGRRLILATAAHRRIAEAVACYLGLFDAVIASDQVYNQKGVFKLAAIRDVVGMGVFDYMGDSIADLPIFQAARVAILVHPSKRLLKRARASCSIGRVFE